jgi:hypothetical protein
VPKTITAGTGDSCPSQMARGVLLEDYPESRSEPTACILSAASETRRVPLPLSEALLRAGLAGPRVSPTESIRNASIQTQLIENYRPIANSLESRIASLHRARQRCYLSSSVKCRSWSTTTAGYRRTPQPCYSKTASNAGLPARTIPLNRWRSGAFRSRLRRSARRPIKATASSFERPADTRQEQPRGRRPAGGTTGP